LLQLWGCVGIALTVKEIRENKLILYGSNLMINDSMAVRIVIKTNLEEKRGRGRTKTKWTDGIVLRMKMASVSERKLGDRAL